MIHKKRLIGAALAGASLLSVATAPSAQAADAKGIFKLAGTASVTYGPYLRLEAGTGSMRLKDAYWHPPGYPVDPAVTFDLGKANSGFGAAALGFDWMNGLRGDISILGTGSMDLAGTWTSPPGGTHATITGGSVRTTAVMGNLFYSPLEQRGINSRLQPFLVVGLGFARNKVSDWTRTNPAAASSTNRTFSGDTSTSLAASVGLGLSWQVTPPGKYPVVLDAAYRYYYFGTAKGGTDNVFPTSGQPPQEPLTFKPSEQVISLSIRIPLKRM